MSVAPPPVLAQGVGRASWTPSTSTTQALPSDLLVPGDSITFQTRAVWEADQVAGLQRYIDEGLRYTHEVNDRSGRLSATGYWATNHPDPAYDRDDDDGDGRWEEAEITAGVEPPVAGATYTSLVQFSRWHGKRQFGDCDWAWDRRQGSTEVLSQLSRRLLGEWQAERYTLTYDTLSYPRVDARPELPDDAAPARCRESRARAGSDQTGVVVTFADPLSWSVFTSLIPSGLGRWTAFEAIGSHASDDLTWTCGGPVEMGPGLAACRDLGVQPEGVVAAVGWVEKDIVDDLRGEPTVARLSSLRDAVTDLLQDVGGFGVQRPDLTIDDEYWELYLAD
jgi:hypothetical protein